MLISDVIKKLGGEIVSVCGDAGFAPSGVCNDHRKAAAGCLFVCVRGYVADGHDFAAGAIAGGAEALVAEKPIGELALPGGAAERLKTYVVVRDARRALAAASHLFYGEPSRKLRLTGVTGTKGKTTTVYMIRSIMREANIKTGMLGTIENDVGGGEEAVVPARETTPESIELAAYLARMAENGCAEAVMEVSSQGLALGRVDFCEFETGVFTNFSRDHISAHEHKNMGDYLAAKLKLFGMCKNAVINADIEEYEAVRGAYLRAAGRDMDGRDMDGRDIDGRAGGGRGVNSGACGRRAAGTLLTYSADAGGANFGAAGVRASDIKLDSDGGARSRFRVETPWFERELTVALPGRYNVYNALAAISVCGLAGAPEAAIARGLERVTVPGRAQSVDMGQNFSVLVDFAHNAASLETLLLLLREHGFASITTVFGCGGDRSRDRRFDMGEVSGKYSDFTIVTSDNPRSEDPELIMADIVTGLRRTSGRYAVIGDRREAIGYAIRNAKERELVIIAGKGHERTQTFSNRVAPFDDVQVAGEFLRKDGRET